MIEPLAVEHKWAIEAMGTPRQIRRLREQALFAHSVGEVALGPFQAGAVFLPEMAEGGFVGVEHFYC